MATISARMVKGKWTGFYSDGSRKTRDGKRKQNRGSKCFPEAKTYEEALDMARRYFVKKNWSLSDALDDYEKHWNISEGSVSSYRSIRRRLIEPYMDNCPLSEIDAHMVVEWRDELSMEGYASSYVNKAHSVLMGAFTYFQGAYGLDVNPVKGVAKLKENQKEAVHFDYDEFATLENLLTEAMSDESVTREGIRRRMTAFAAYTALHFGLRCGECCALTRADVDEMRNVLFVRHTVVGNSGPPHLGPPKGRRERHFSCADDLWLSKYREHLRWHKKWRGVPVAKNEPLITFNGSWPSPAHVSNWFSTMRDEWGLPKETHFHTLRHTHATYSLAVLKQDLSEVSRRLGHADVSTTAHIYSHAIPAQDEASARSFGEMARRLADGR